MENSLSNNQFIKTNRVCTLMITHQCNLNCVYCFEKHKSNKRMSFPTAKKILEEEFFHYAETAQKDTRLAIELFGGEPLTNFTLIKNIYEWVKAIQLPFNYIFQITTNGTLLTDDIKQWLIKRKEDFRLVLSVDGTEAMQEKNRSCQLSTLPIAFIKEVWPNSYFKLTLSHDTLKNYAEGVISLYEKGYKIASSLAEGQNWEYNDIDIYKNELEKIGNFFLTHLEKQLEHPFNFLFKEYLEPRIHDKIPHKNCGVGTTIAMYDTDGVLYPCHLFLPMVHGNQNVLEEVKDINWNESEQLIDKECQNCLAIKICKTCYGYNYSERGNITYRDRNMCHLRLTEAKVISEFQIKYYTKKKQLTGYELLLLKAALECYKHIKDLYLDKNGKVKKGYIPQY